VPNTYRAHPVLQRVHVRHVQTESTKITHGTGTPAAKIKPCAPEENTSLVLLLQLPELARLAEAGSTKAQTATGTPAAKIKPRVPEANTSLALLLQLPEQMVLSTPCRRELARWKLCIQETPVTNGRHVSIRRHTNHTYFFIYLLFNNKYNCTDQLFTFT